MADEVVAPTLPTVFAALGCLSASAFHEPAAVGARRIRAFFDRHLRS